MTTNHLLKTGTQITLVALCLLTTLAAQAQTYLTDAFKPTEERGYRAYPTKGDGVMEIAIYKYKGGFTLSSGRGGLISSNTPGYAVFDIPAGYEKISFVVGPDSPNSASDEHNCIFTLKADGKRIVDKVIWNHDAPQEVVADIKGARQLRFDIPKGETNLALGSVKLWKAGQPYKPSGDPLRSIPSNGRVQLVGQLWPHFIRHSGWVHPITKRTDVKGIRKEESFSINRVEYKTGLQFTADQALAGNNEAWAYFWLQKKYDKVSFIIGPGDNQASAATGWLTVKADGKIIYEKRLTQQDLAEQVVLDVAGVNKISFHSIDEDSRILGGIRFACVNIFAYPPSYTAALPTAGVINASKGRLSKLPDVCKLVSNIKPYSVQGMASFENSVFDGESDYITFSMGGEQFSEGFILTSGKTLFDDNISAYYKYDLAGEFDYMTFTVGALTKRRTQCDDDIRIYCDGKVVLDTVIHVTWPNQRFTIPLNKCRTLTFAKPGNMQQRDSYFGIGDVVLYRGEVVENDLFQHPKPECPPEADLIDLCKAPYYHYVGRYLSVLTNFDFNDCFQNGGSQRRYFQMHDGTKIYKGVMLETNIPPALENITPMGAVFMFLTGVGSSVSGSDVSAHTGTTGGVSGPLTGGLLSLFSGGGKQSSAAAFNPYGEYDECTFTVACKQPYVDPGTDLFGDGKAPPVRLDVFADQVKVGEFMVSNEMKPTTYTVPIRKCHQLMFWLECGDVRSGQYVLYDMKVRKKGN
ncbi:MAG: NPCBM/NEW2 domain-containing protein [Bacteroidaceae bacterium]|nr:NPCBM/NEW2 domain-containing protein [Bacteroidaceae bacterium]